MSHFDVIVPCITNTVDIASKAEIVLKWEKKAEDPKETDRKKRVISAYSVSAPKKTKR